MIPRTVVGYDASTVVSGYGGSAIVAPYHDLRIAPYYGITYEKLVRQTKHNQ